MATEVYCDESRPELFVSQTKPEANTLIGSLWIPDHARDSFKAAVWALRSKHGVWGEIKWTKVSPAKLAFHTELIDLFMDNSDIRFRCIVIDASKLDLARFHKSDGELGFYKFYYQLLTQWIVDGGSYRIYCDDKVNRDRTRLQTLEQVLRRKHTRSSIDHLQGVDSSQSVLIQTCDLLLGIAQSKFNKSTSSSAAKRSLVEHLESRLRRPIGPTWRSEQKFNAFAIQLNEVALG